MNYKIINLVTFLCCLTLMSLYFSPVVNKATFKLDDIDIDPGRNEGSTPRTFVLPATPAVAKEQERKQVALLKKNEIQKCMLKLYDQGLLNIYNFDDIFDFKITLGIIKYQKQNQLQVSGEFDMETKNHLGCI